MVALMHNCRMSESKVQSEIREIVGSWMLDVIERDKITAEAWGKLAGVSATTVTRLVDTKLRTVRSMGTTPTARSLHKLVKAASVPLVFDGRLPKYAGFEEEPRSIHTPHEQERQTQYSSADDYDLTIAQRRMKFLKDRIEAPYDLSAEECNLIELMRSLPSHRQPQYDKALAAIVELVKNTE